MGLHLSRAMEEAEPPEAAYVEEESKREAFVKVKPVRRAQGASIEETQAGSPRAPALKALALNHAAVGFAALPRPNLGFDGAWLAAPKMMVHIIKRDPSVPRRLCSWREQYAGEPEAWMIRRSAHLAFEVGSLEEAEHALRQHGVEYSRHVLPEANMRQLFLYDPEGHGIELGMYDDSRTFLQEHGVTPPS